MPKVTVVAEVVAKKEFVERLRSELLKLITPTKNEDGCIEYRLHQDHDDPAVFIFYENWENEACLAKHLNSDHFNTYISAIDGMLEKKIVHRMTMIA